jgi:hypothetical protein
MMRYSMQIISDEFKTYYSFLIFFTQRGKEITLNSVALLPYSEKNNPFYDPWLYIFHLSPEYFQMNMITAWRFTLLNGYNNTFSLKIST